VHEELADHFASSSVKISKHEHELVDVSLKYEDGKVSAASEASTRAAARNPNDFCACDAHSLSSRSLMRSGGAVFRAPLSHQCPTFGRCLLGSQRGGNRRATWTSVQLGCSRTCGTS
jgi:hypothetical protein